MRNFVKYSRYYDILYRDKNYPAEVRFLEKLMGKFSGPKVKRIISLGCGSGSHEMLLAKKGYTILGLDKSESMLSIFRNKIKKNNLSNRILMKRADVSDFKIKEKYDCAISMFNVVGYQTENSTYERMLRCTSRSLKKGGLLMFDCWHGAAVLKDRPTDRVKEVRLNGSKIIRLTSSKLDTVNNIIEITFKVIEIENQKIVDEVKEVHNMRYWSIPELKYFLNKSGFSILGIYNFMDLKSKVSDNKWDIFVVARKNK